MPSMMLAPISLPALNFLLPICKIGQAKQFEIERQSLFKEA